ncbi:hypothetical protein [Streptomyces sp. DASNCL29]|uniref:hypothetical protein n=1 Tax=Streptomyces sp. DASNCL29 TaxID=2583819 RepID=UPI00110FCFC0|nr:hypothetical protein [Streptomyces sp. DASNCL29]TMU98213.1 hypothetical protein FGK60_10410 [Streptomyces sp. DASNCL29]
MTALPPPMPAHWHCYRWTGERRTLDDESARRPPHMVVRDISPQEWKQIAATSPAFMASEVPPLEVPHWLLRPVRMIKNTFEAPDKAASWYRDQVSELSPSFMSAFDKEPDRQAEWFAAADGRLRWGGDVVGGWYLRGTGFASVQVVACSSNRIRPTIPCPMH